MTKKNKYKSEKLLKKIKKSYAWSGLLSSIIFMSLVTVLLIMMLNAALSYTIESWMSTEYDRVSYMAKLYESSGAAEVSKYDGDDGEYLVVDKSGTPVYEHGENTCSMEEFKAELYSKPDAGQISVYPDSKISIFEVKDNKISMNMMLFSRDYIRVDNLDSFIQNGIIRYPIWMGVPLSDGEHTFIGCSRFNIDKADITFIVVIASVIAVLFLIMVITFIWRLIRAFINQRKVSSLVFNDEVTLGNNWMYFRIKGEQILRRFYNRKNRYAVLDIDFVNYRNYCVCHSVEEGDNKLRMIHKKIDSQLSTGELSGRYASSNFAVLMRADNEDAFKARLNLLLFELEKVDSVHKLGFHIGVDYIDPEIDKNGKMIKRKDIDIEKCYNNACAARVTLDGNDESGMAFFDDKLFEEQKWIDAVHERQLAALNNEEFVVYYQPKYNPSTNTLKGAEALIRWQSSDLGFIPPGRFIPIFEKNGFITEIDHYMIRHVARDQKAWLDKGFNCVPVSVNVSRAHFIEEDLAEQIRDIVDAEGAPHDLIEIELTESAFFDDKKALITTISRLQGYGFAVSMDDFGSGYSSLNSLKDLPLNVLKLDAEFFRGDMEGDRGEIVISETIRLAQALNMRTVAEGVEIREQVDFLAEHGCDMIQGYYYAKPMPASEYEQRMKEPVSEDSGEDSGK
ncbi:MAG: bifunctional diguanylate cyclase/phosphodiesterase [Lachnospiraceae bacterium]|nr:bifunctional diguanylate cyclase/phosphodiesterase [Lachnospiraceae bacterium]